MSLSQSIRGMFRELKENPEDVEERDAADAFDLPDLEQMIEEGADPQFAMYSSLQTLFLQMATVLEQTGEFDEYHDAIELASGTYLAGYPPMSPVTDSCFYLWTLCDMRFGSERQNIGEVIRELLGEADAPDKLTEMLDRLLSSRMGIYETIGHEDDVLVVRELVTDRELLVDVPTGYLGSDGELRFVRLAPPLSDNADYFTELTTPYILTGQSAGQWTGYLRESMPEVAARPDGSESSQIVDRLASVFKDDCGALPWMEFVFQGYSHYQSDAVFLSGIPDEPDSLPHGETTAATSPHLAGQSDIIRRAKQLGITIIPPSAESRSADISLRLTEAQRRIAAELLPELGHTFLIAGKGKKKVTVNAETCERLSDAVEVASEDAHGSRLTTMRNLLTTVNEFLDPASESEESHGSRSEVIYRMRIDLRGTKPPIWRRIETPDCSLAQFHHLVQAAMGWTNSHPHEFEVDGERFSIPHPFASDDLDHADSEDIWLSHFIHGKGKTFTYLYDFGDSWEHSIEVEAVAGSSPAVTYPRCAKGRGNCPPEDCGGIWGYSELLGRRSGNDDADEYEDDWGGNIDPGYFDAEERTQDMQSCFVATPKTKEDTRISAPSEPFDIHADVFSDGELDEHAFHNYCECLIDEFEDSPEFDKLPDGDYGYLTCLLDYGAGYLGATPATMTVGELQEIVFDILPRKVAMEPSDAEVCIMELNAFFRFLHRQYAIAGAPKLVELLDRDAAKKLAAALDDPSNFGIAKSFFSMGESAGFDMRSDGGMRQFMQVYNASLAQDHTPVPIAEPEPPAVSTIRRSANRTGRNDPCHCGSGRKYKKCCLPLET